MIQCEEIDVYLHPATHLVTTSSLLFENWKHVCQKGRLESPEQ